MDENKRKGFSFLRSYFEAAKELPREEQADFLMAICEYAFDGKEPEIHGIASAMFKLAKPNIDPRRSLAESLVEDIPLDVCTLAYNMSFEKNVIKSLALEFPDLRDHLLNIHEHIKDLMIPFYNREYYTKAMQGSYSIKYVLPALFPDDPSLNYHNLEEVHNGTEAMNAYATMGELSKEEQEKLRENLLKYCGLDTYAMVKIYDKLKEII